MGFKGKYRWGGWPLTMHVACRLLASSRQGVDQIAVAVGYESPAAFNRAFKKHVGVPPAAWRVRVQRLN